jgi:phytoene dehydrogenase-like protein
MAKSEYDAVVVGSGPNGLAAAITLQQRGLSVLLLEGKATIGGGLRSAELTLPGYLHDICSAVHPLAMASPFFRSLPLDKFGLRFVVPPAAAAHPLDDGTAAVLLQNLQETAAALGSDAPIYTRLLKPLVQNWEQLLPDLLAPLRIPRDPLGFAGFGLNALPSAAWMARSFHNEAAKALWAGMAAHSIQPLNHLTTSAIALVLMAAGHTRGWGFPQGGAQRLADALGAYFLALGGEIETNFQVASLGQLPSSKAVLLDVTPRQLLKIAGHRFSSLYRWQLEKYRYGMGVFKVDWALAEPIPFLAEVCRQSGTVHLGGTFGEIANSEQQTWRGQHPELPFVLLAQQSLFDPSRAPKGKQVAWAYCHVPHGSRQDMTEAIERQVERFAPGFRERILARHVMDTAQMEAHNPNYIGGDINGGVIDLGQLFTRPALRYSPYRTSAKGIYLCSSSTPPGGGVHGMCGYHAAQRVLKDFFTPYFTLENNIVL